MTKELKQIIDEAEVMFSSLNRNHIKYLKATIKQAYHLGKREVYTEELKRYEKN